MLYQPGRVPVEKTPEDLDGGQSSRISHGRPRAAEEVNPEKENLKRFYGKPQLTYRYELTVAFKK